MTCDALSVAPLAGERFPARGAGGGMRKNFAFFGFFGFFVDLRKRLWER